MRRILSLTVVLAALATASAVAQTTITVGPVPAGSRLSFLADRSIATVSEALTFEARLSRNGAPLTAATSTSGLTCSAPIPPATNVSCQWVLTQSSLDALNMVGVHNLTVTMFRSDVGESPASLPFVLKSPAGAPLAVSVIQ